MFRHVIARTFDAKKAFQMKQKLIIPCELPALNEVIDKSKRHWAEYAKQKKQWTRFVALLARLNLKPVEKQVSLSILWVCANRKRDPDNIVAGGRKVILDGLVEARILKGDGWKQVCGFTDAFAVDNHRPRVEVEINEILDNAKFS